MSPEEVRHLLPWYAAGTLGAEEARRVAQELEQSPALQRELEEFRLLGEVTRAPAAEPELSPGAFDAVLRRVDAYEAQQRPRAPARQSGGFERLRQMLADFWDPLPAGGRWAVAVQFAVIVVLAGVLSAGHGALRSGEPSFTTLSANRPAGSPAAAFSVIFQPEATAAQIDALLQETGLVIVDGPNEQQTYAVGFARGGQSGATPADGGAEAALQKLRASTAVVRYAAPMAP
jgi:hypothetical protein